MYEFAGAFFMVLCKVAAQLCYVGCKLVERTILQSHASVLCPAVLEVFSFSAVIHFQSEVSLR